MTHKIVVVYQSLLGIYGDHGNAVVLTKRLTWRGIDAQLLTVEPGTPLPDDALVYLLGGGEDLAQIAAVKALQADHGMFAGLDKGAVLFAVCAGYQILGHSFTVGDDDQVQPGLGLLDVETRRSPRRAVGEILTQAALPGGGTTLITGYENHGGFTSLGSDAKPLARVIRGVGNGNDGYDGAVQGRIVATYPHGPILPRNPQLADAVLELALGEKLPPLDHPVEQAHARLRERRLHIVRTTKNLQDETR